MISLLIDRVRLLFLRERKPYYMLKDILGFYPHHIELYVLALKHKSLHHLSEEEAKKYKKKIRKIDTLNNERLEFLGDAILGAIVADILYRKFGTKQEGFLTTLRSRIVCRKSLNQIANQMGLGKLILHSGDVYKSHNSYVNGNAFEALCGAVYLDRGYKYCYRFIEKEIFGKYVSLDEMLQNSPNYKSRLLEWCQKHQYKMQFVYDESREQTGPVFKCQVLIEGVVSGKGKGYKKVESDQLACKEALQAIEQDSKLALRIAETVEARNRKMQQRSRYDKSLAELAGRKTIVFDLDGTLMDTLQDLYLSTNYALRTCGYPERTLDEIRSFVGNGVQKLIMRAMPAEPDMEDEEGHAAFQRCFEAFKNHYIKHCQDNTRLYPGIDKLLAELKEKGYRLAIVSNKLQAGVTELYEKWFKDSIEVAIGESANVRRKPAPDMVEEALRQLGTQKEDAIYVGDSDVDLQTACNSGLPCISVLWGFRSKEFLQQQGAVIMAENPDKIVDLLSKSARRDSHAPKETKAN